MLQTWLVILLSFPFLVRGNDFSDQELAIYVFELNPLIYKEQNTIKGSWFNSFERLSKLTKIKFKYQFTSIPRLEILLASNKPGCSLTLLKTKERVEDMKINFIHDHKRKTIFKIYQRKNNEVKWSLKRMQSQSQLKVVTNTSVGINFLKEKGIKAELLFNINSIINMLMINRIDIFVGSNLAVEETKEFKDGLIEAGEPLKTLVHGIGCSRGTSEKITSQIKTYSNSWHLE